MTGEPLRLATAAMGTRFELALIAGRGDLRAAGEAALEEIETCHRLFSRFAPDSLLSHINRTAARARVRLDRHTHGLFEDALQVWRASGGAFDITIAPLMGRNGFADSAVPADSARVGSDAIRLDPERWTIRFTRPDVALDLGAIAKGHALDRAAAVLREGGVACALLHGGTSGIVAIGAPPAADGFRVAIGSEPGAPCVLLRDTAMSVSNPAAQSNGIDEAGHVIDPRTGTALETAAHAVVIGPSATLADAWSTALAVLRPAFAPGFAQRFGAAGWVPEAFPRGWRAMFFASSRDLQPLAT